jgi:aminoglycoside phosphotransferase (APT) family kinase protein
VTDRWDDLGAWLAPRLGAVGPVVASGLGGPAATGYSAETTIFTAAFESAAGPVERRFVLRSEVPGPATYPAQAPAIDVDIEIQYRLMQAVARASTVPVAAILDYEPEPSVIGAPFFVMDFVEGVVPEVMPPYTASGFFADAQPEQRTRMITRGLQTLAEIHRSDWRSAGLDWLVTPGEAPTTARQLGLWERAGHVALGDRRHAPMEQAAEILHRHLPEGSEPTLCWGDARPGNIIWRDFECASVTDWEAASIAPPESDVGWWLMFDRTMHEACGADRLAGEPTREEQLGIYEDAAGRRVEAVELHEMFAAYRYCVVVVQLANRFVERGIPPADNDFWIANPIVATLTDLMGI